MVLLVQKRNQISKKSLAKNDKLVMERIKYEPRREKTCLRGFQTWSDTNQAAQPQKMARGLKFQI